MKAVVLLSGGLDSTTMLKMVQSQGYIVTALTFEYGQRHHVEVVAAREIAQRYGIIDHRIAQIDLRVFGGSALTDNSIPLNKNTSKSSCDTNFENIPTSYVPARNTIFLSYAIGLAEVIMASKVFIGINAIDYSGYPDCRPEYLKSFNDMSKLATAVGIKNELQIEVVAPLLYLSKAEIIKIGMQLKIDYSQTISCYDPTPLKAACGKCDACILRLAGFAMNNLKDNAVYC